MRMKPLLWCAAGLLVTLARTTAATLYVDAASTNAVPPFTNWATSATNIQDAVDAAAPGDEILVTNGIYQTGGRAVYGMSNRVAVTKAVTVRSVSGPANTVINGMGNSRCAYMTNGAVLEGFTLTNGKAQYDGELYPDNCGGGVWCEGLNAVLSNCVVANCSAYEDGGGAFSGTLNNCVVAGNEGFYGGGAYASALNNCTLTGNFAEGGGGAYLSTLNNCMLTNNGSYDGGGARASTLKNCTLTGNSAETGGGTLECALIDSTLTGNSAYSGGGAVSSTLSNCILRGNWTDNPRSSYSYGGGAYGSKLNNCLITENSSRDEFGRGGGVYSSTLTNCTLTGNSASDGGGAMNSTLNNCMVMGNVAGGDYGAGGGALFCMLYNCTLTGNLACGWESSAGGGAYGSALTNCIVYYNRACEGGDNYAASTFNYSCTTPDPGSGVGNITYEPAFMDLAGGNLLLQFNSPCINAGNNAYVTTATDLEGLPRIAGGPVDIGAYEFQSPASAISYAWLQQSGLPTDGSADYVDTDHDGHNNWQEWISGTDPTDALSILRLLPLARSGADVILTWLSVTNRTYVLECSTNLAATPPFTTLATNLPGQPGATSWTDTNATVSSPRFYQLRVSP